MNKYYRILDKILATGKTQTNKKGNIQYLLNEQLSLTPADLLDIFEGHNIARKKLRSYLCRVSATWRSTGRSASTGGTIAAPSW
jgi:predicted aldo/keto reductase-like oxidoreductase